MSLTKEAIDVLDEVEAVDRASDTSPSLNLGARMILLRGGAQISSITVKIDKLLQTKRVSDSALLTKALMNIKRDVLVGLSNINEGIMELKE